jgi:hypothetical protein
MPSLAHVDENAAAVLSHLGSASRSDAARIMLTRPANDDDWAPPPLE